MEDYEIWQRETSNPVIIPAVHRSQEDLEASEKPSGWRRGWHYGWMLRPDWLMSDAMWVLVSLDEAPGLVSPLKIGQSSFHGRAARGCAIEGLKSSSATHESRREAQRRKDGYPCAGQQKRKAGLMAFNSGASARFSVLLDRTMACCCCHYCCRRRGILQVRSWRRNRCCGRLRGRTLARSL